MKAPLDRSISSANLARHEAQAAGIRTRVESRVYMSPEDRAKQLRNQGLSYRVIGQRMQCSSEHARRLCLKGE